VRNKTGTDSQGVSRQEGNQTLKAERSGQVKLAVSGPSNPDVLKGSKAHERCWFVSADWLRPGWVKLSGRLSSTSGCRGTA
jgi:hypothetical protein